MGNRFDLARGVKPPPEPEPVPEPVKEPEPTKPEAPVELRLTEPMRFRHNGVEFSGFISNINVSTDQMGGANYEITIQASDRFRQRLRPLIPNIQPRWMQNL